MTGVSKPVRVAAMSLPPPEHESFKIRLRSVMEEQGLTIYGLARLIDPVNPEAAERNLYRWLSPSSTSLPSLASRRALARALGVDESFFDPRIGVEGMREIARAYAQAELREKVIRRRVWVHPDGPHGGCYLTSLERELVSG